MTAGFVGMAVKPDAKDALDMIQVHVYRILGRRLKYSETIVEAEKIIRKAAEDAERQRVEERNRLRYEHMQREYSASRGTGRGTVSAS